MPALIVPCPHCSQPSKIDTDRLPDQPVSYACPHCKQKVNADKSKLLQQAAAATPSAEPPAPEEKTAAKTIPLPPAILVDERFSQLPSDARFPSGIVVGDDASAVEDVRSKLAAVGCQLIAVESAEIARNMIVNNGCDLCIVVAGGQATSPYAPMAPLLGLPEAIRRQTYLVLVADNVKTLDGSAAFMFQVNAVLSRQDPGHLEAALHAGIAYHERLYRPYLQAVELQDSF
jgi:hypothetical protein